MSFMHCAEHGMKTNTDSISQQHPMALRLLGKPIGLPPE